MSKEKPVRHAAKALIVNSDGEVLVVKGPRSGNLPGGGIKAGENYPDALARELDEELGIQNDDKRVILDGFPSIHGTCERKDDILDWRVTLGRTVTESIKFTMPSDEEILTYAFMKPTQLYAEEFMRSFAKTVVANAFNHPMDIPDNITINRIP